MDAALHYEIVPARPRHVAMLLRDLRPEEHDEITALGLDPRSAILQQLRTSVAAGSAFLGDDIAAMWGIGGSLLGHEGYMWLVTTPVARRYPLELVKRCREGLRQMATGKKILLAHCAEKHVNGMRFLQMIGFRVDEPFVAPATGEIFRVLRFEV